MRCHRHSGPVCDDFTAEFHMRITAVKAFRNLFLQTIVDKGSESAESAESAACASSPVDKACKDGNHFYFEVHSFKGGS